MLRGKTRIPPVDIDAPERPARNARGTAQAPGARHCIHTFYTRNAAFFRAAKEMWTACNKGRSACPVR